MKFESCPMEKEVVAAVRGGQWPAACEPALRTHVQECKSCSQAASLFATFAEMRTAATENAPLGAPGLLFWKAQIRRRNQAMEHMTRPILAAEIVGFAVTLFVLAGIAWKWIYASGSDGLDTIQNLASVNIVGNWGWSLVAAAGITLALFGGVALYLVTAKE